MYRLGQNNGETQRGTWTRYWPFGSTAFGILVGGTAGDLLARKLFATSGKTQRIVAEFALGYLGWQFAEELYKRDYYRLMEGAK